MADCFISYKREDRARVAPIAQALRAAGHTVWWDADLTGGARWRDTIVAELAAARCVLVCWTRDSVGPAGAYVREEAEQAKHRGALLPLRLDEVKPPFGFGEVQAVDLAGWAGDADDPAWQAVLRGVQAVLSGDVAPPTEPPRHRRRWARVVGGLAVALPTLGLLADVTGLHATVCKPDSRWWAVCRSVGLGPDAAEAAAWSKASAAEVPEPIKAYLARYPSGAYAAEAQARLAACRQVVDETWLPYSGTPPLVVPSGPLRPAPSEAAAREAMRAEVQRDAADACSAAPLSELYRAVPGQAGEIPAGGWDCKAADGGWRCRYDGRINCPQERRQRQARDICPKN